MIVTVLGGGNGSHAAVADLVLRSHEVRWRRRGALPDRLRYLLHREIGVVRPALATRRRLAPAGLRPGGQEAAGQIMWRSRRAAPPAGSAPRCCIRPIWPNRAAEYGVSCASRGMEQMARRRSRREMSVEPGCSSAG
jgi:hypothetical protein